MCTVSLILSSLQSHVLTTLTSILVSILDYYTKRLRAFTVAITATFCPILHSQMLRNQLIALRSSDAVDVMFANPVTGTVEILFMTGHAYKFKNVSRRAIVNLILNPNMSLGFWVNENLTRSARVNYLSQGILNPELRKYSCDELTRQAAAA